MAATSLPRMVSLLRDELDLEPAKTKAVVEAACATIGCDNTGTLIDRARRCLDALGVPYCWDIQCDARPAFQDANNQCERAVSHDVSNQCEHTVFHDATGHQREKNVSLEASNQCEHIVSHDASNQCGEPESRDASHNQSEPQPETAPFGSASAQRHALENRQPGRRDASNAGASRKRRRRRKRAPLNASPGVFLSPRSDSSLNDSLSRACLCKRGVTVSNKKLCCSVFVDEDGACEVEALDIDSNDQFGVVLTKASLARIGIELPGAAANDEATTRFCSEVLRRLRLHGDQVALVAEGVDPQDPAAPLDNILSYGTPEAKDSEAGGDVRERVEVALRECCESFERDNFWRDLAKPIEFARAELAKMPRDGVTSAESTRARAARAIREVCRQLHGLNRSGTAFFKEEHARLTDVLATIGPAAAAAS